MFIYPLYDDKLMCPNLSHAFDDIVESKHYTYDQLNSRTTSYYGDKIYSGHVHMLAVGSAILITEDLFHYMIGIHDVDAHNLKTGDYIKAKVGYDPQYENSVVIEITEVLRNDYDKLPVVRSDRTFNIKDKNVRFGTTAMLDINDNIDSYEQMHLVFDNAPADTAKMVLSFDGRRENFADTETVYITKPEQNSRDKLSTCLLAFFRAKQIASTGKDVIMFIDSFDKMYTVFNNCMQIITTSNPSTVSLPAVSDLEGILCSSANLRDQGSLTIIGSHRCNEKATNEYVTERFYQISDTII